MSLLANIAEKAQSTQAQDMEERVSSGSSKRIEESGCYTAVVTMAKLREAQSGAIGIDIELKTEDEKEIKITEWIQSGDAKGNKTTYTDKEGNEVNLPGFTKVKNINFLINGVFGLPTGETKQIKEYSWDEKKDILVTREVITSWINRPVGICVQMTMEDKYNAENEFTTRPIIEHFYDAVTNQFGSEKMSSKEAELKEKFLTYIEKTPIKDKRKKSKGATEASGATNNTQTTQTSTDVGF